MGETGIDFDGDPPVDPVGVLEDLGQQITGPKIDGLVVTRPRRG
jgi:hypothetical protein